MRAIQITEFGGPEVLRYAEIVDPQPRDGQVLIEVSRAGVNFSDTHHAEDTYLLPTTLPYVPGGEVAGTVPDGTRVVALLANGGYAQRAVADQARVFRIPEGVDAGQALALVLQGVTAWHLLRTSARLLEGESVVVHAAAGGVGSLAVQLAKQFGAGRVIATASTDDKRALALSLGADAAVDDSPLRLRDRLIEANDGDRVDVVLEMVGDGVFTQSLDALAPFGRLVAYGTASRIPAPTVAPPALMRHSRTVAGFWLGHCYERPSRLTVALEDLFARTQRGALRPVVGATYPLSEARRAHEDLRARRTTGKILLDPAR
jgi:NADPH:quinone reductase